MHDVNSGGRDDVPTTATEDKPREEFHEFDNNNDSKYLHKKFKKMASAVQSREDGHSSLRPGNEPPPRQSTESEPDNERKEESCEVPPKEASNGTGNGRHVCPYCKLSCAKPSVLQKHIRAHTNERPYPCVPCGFAFKTKSNLYKHCRSRSHALRLHGTEDTPNNDEEWSLGSDADAASVNSTRPDSNPIVVRPDSNSNSDSVVREPERSSPDATIDSRPKSIYKPKFHKASFYREEDDARKGALSPNPDFLDKHISKIISDNEVIVKESLDPPMQRRYGAQRQSSGEMDVSDYSRGENQPLNLTKNSDSSESNGRKRCHSDSFAAIERSRVPQHPLNPEGSIIKDLLLKARAQAGGFLPIAGEGYDSTESLYICPLCQIPYKSADNLEFHRLYYCKGSPNALGAMLNGVNDSSKYSRSESVYMRSNSRSSDIQSPNSLAKMASATLKSPLRRSNKPENLVILKSEHSEVSAPLPSPGPLLGNTRLVDTQTVSDSSRVSYYEDSEKFIRSSPALKRRTESQSSESASSLSRVSEDNFQRSDMYSPPNKIRCSETPASLRSLEELSLSPMRQSATSLQMFGGEVKITDNSGGTTTMRIEPTSQQSPTMISQSRISPLPQGPETSSVLVRSGLHSGATIVHNPPTPKEPLPSPHPQTPRLLVSIAPNISTPNLAVAGIPAPNMSNFQFPIGPITAYNPLTLPPLSPVASPGGPSTILHSGKLIPYVPGIPGPNTLGSYPPLQKSLKFNASNENANNAHDSTLMRTEKSFKDRLKNNYISETDYNHKVTDLKLSQMNLKNSSYQTINSLDKKENIHRNNSMSKTLPIIKINAEEPQSPVNERMKDGNSLYLNKRMAQIKIDEILRKNSEILQKTTNSLDMSSPKIMRSEYKVHQQQLPKGLDSEEYSDSSKGNLSYGRKDKKHPTLEVKQFNFENFISKSEIPNKLVDMCSEASSSTQPKSMEDTSEKASERSETAYFKKTANATSSVASVKSDNQNSKFLRPTSLPLKPGTFTPKKHHGITPNANTLPLISPETPRPAKAYGQLYLNGHAYTYLGLKCSTKVCYCTLNRLQPTYVPNQHSLSMYSNWQVCSESTPHPLGLAPGQAMSHYDSRHRPQNYTVAKIKQDQLMTHSSQWSVKVSVQNESEGPDDSKSSSNDMSSNNKNKSLAGGFESNEEYTYVRGRGRGRYVCSECGIRCKKPSMLKKHIRTHTDVRPFTCKHCVFSFKTKGNLTKHMKSKAHYRKCCELGISPLEGIDSSDMSQGLGESDEESDSDDDGNEGETESSDTDSCKSRLEHEAAHCLLSLWGGRPAPGLLTTARPTTYPYTPNNQLEDTKYSDSSRISPYKEVSTSTISRKLNTAPMGSKHDKMFQVRRSNFSPMDLSKPVDLSKSDVKDINGKSERTLCSAEEVLTPVGEPDLLASLALSMDKLPQRVSHWSSDEPMLQAYLTEKALQDSRIKQCQYTNGKLRQHDVEFNSSFSSSVMLGTSLDNTSHSFSPQKLPKEIVITTSAIVMDVPILKSDNYSLNEMQSSAANNDNIGIETLAEIAASSARLKTPVNYNNDKKPPVSNSSNDKPMGTENAKFVASEYLKSVSGKAGSENADVVRNKIDKVEVVKSLANIEENVNFEKESDVQKLNVEHMGVARKVVVGAGGVGFKLTPSSEISPQVAFSKAQLTEDGKSICVVCNKTFSKPSQLLLHINIHYIERPFRCSACAVSFRTRGHLQKHERSGSHHNKVSMTSTFGAATTTNPRPFKCSDCKIAFRIHGHLAKHLRSKMHVMRLECLGKLPFGTFAEIERAGVSLTDIDTTDCDNSLASLQILAQKLHDKDPTKLDKWDPVTMTPPLLPPGAESSDEEDPPSPNSQNVHMDDYKNVNDSDSLDETHAKYSATNT